MRKLPGVLSIFLFIASAHAGPPAIITEFCALHFPEGIAAPGQPYEPTDMIVDPELPSRRMVEWMVTDSQTYFWYEHGGYSPHHHLVRFDNLHPQVVSESYVFFDTPYKDIASMIKDKGFLSANVARDAEL